MIANGILESILVATDLTDNSHESLRCAGDLAKASGAKLHIVHVEEGPGISLEDRDVLTEQRQVHTKRIALLNLLAEVLPANVDFESARVRRGPAAEGILREASDVEADVIILGAHRDRGFADRFRGSTAELVLRQSTVPCLVMNAPLPLPVYQIVVPTDFSAPAQRAIRTALDWGRILSGNTPAELMLTHVVTGSAEETEPWVAADLESDLHTAIRDAVGTGSAPAQVSVRVLRGTDPVDTLISHAEASEATLMILGTQGDGVLLRALLGSVSSAMVRRAPFPLLLVPPAAGPAADADRERGASAAGRSQEITL